MSPRLAHLVLAALAAPAWAASKLEVSAAAGIDSAYDDNVYNGRGPDFVNRISPQGTLRAETRRLKFEAGYQFGFWTYAFAKAESSLNHRAQGSLEARLARRVILRIADEFTRAEDPGFLSRVGVVAPQ